jgi:antitoxin component YwqK of YwqJK toxin-antitoxin module
MIPMTNHTSTPISRMLTTAAYTICLLTLSALSTTAQTWQKFSVTEEGDTLNRIDIKGLRQGPWLIRVEPLRLEPGYEEEGEFVDGKKQGVWKRYTLQGDMIAVERFREGYKDGLQTYFTRIGEPLREEHWKYVDPKNPYDTIDVPDLDNPMLTKSMIIKLESAEVRHGEWKYFDPSTGRVMKTEQYISGQKFGAPGSIQAAQTAQPEKKDTPKTVQKPKAVEEWEKNNQGKKKVTVRDGRTGG